MKTLLLSAATLLSLALSATAQYTPGVGGIYVPSTPVVPGPSHPQAPSGPTPPSYTWETPPQQQPVYQPQPGQPVYQPQSTSILPPADPIRVTAPAYLPQLTEAQMADLTAAIALYPDALLAEMLPAATFLEQLTFADRWLEQHPGIDERAIDALPLDPNVRDMMHYPTVLNLLTDHLDWTQSLALAFAYQRPDLFESIQRWRSVAVTNGYLFSTQQQDVLQQGSLILIQPAPRTQVIYVPVYDPAVVYVHTRPLQAPRNVIAFSTSGFSLSFAFNDLDWHNHEVRVPHRDSHDGPDSHGGPGGPGGPGHGPSDNRTVFVPNNPRPGMAYPQKLVTPQPDKKVITLPPPNPGRGPDSGRGRSGN